jgi:hypothetical protein
VESEIFYNRQLYHAVNSYFTPLAGFAQKVFLGGAFFEQNRSIWSRKAVRIRPERPY